MSRALVLILLLGATSAQACPFCDLGGVEAAQFILAVFVPVMAGGLLVLFSIRRSQRRMGRRDPALKIFDAEK